MPTRFGRCALAGATEAGIGNGRDRFDSASSGSMQPGGDGTACGTAEARVHRRRLDRRYGKGIQAPALPRLRQRMRAARARAPRCPSSLMVTPLRQNPTIALVTRIFATCAARSHAELMALAQEKLTSIWPDLRLLRPENFVSGGRA
jgi:hypothetical protein